MLDDNARFGQAGARSWSWAFVAWDVGPPWPAAPVRAGTAPGRLRQTARKKG